VLQLCVCAWFWVGCVCVCVVCVWFCVVRACTYARVVLCSVCVSVCVRTRNEAGARRAVSSLCCEPSASNTSN